MAGSVAKGTVGEAVPVVALLVKDGHDQLGASVHWSAPSGRSGRAPLQRADNDRWVGAVEPAEVGPYELTVVAWTDRFATLAPGRDAACRGGPGHHGRARGRGPAGRAPRRSGRGSGRRRAAGRGGEGPAPHGLLHRRPAGGRPRPRGGGRRRPGRTGLGSQRIDAAPAVGRPGSGGVQHLVRAVPPLLRRPAGGALPAAPPGRHGLRRAVPAARPPHRHDPPQGPQQHAGGPARRRRQPLGDRLCGRRPRRDRPGPRHGRRLRPTSSGTPPITASRSPSTTPCSARPTTPGWREHPEWFHRRPDGTIRFAENPPKKYQDIYPINFWPEREADRAALWAACHDVLVHWIGLGVRIFRVDNPHTKPLAFWAWLIAEVQRQHPDVIFLAEAFTRAGDDGPPGRDRLHPELHVLHVAHGRWELTEYLQQLASPPARRRHAPELLAEHARHPGRRRCAGGPPAPSRLRFVLAATLVPNYGIYSGFELGENQPAAPDNPRHEYLDSEKYQIKRPQLGAQPSAARRSISRVNWSRRQHPALAAAAYAALPRRRQRRAPRVLEDRPAARRDVVLVIVNLDPHGTAGGHAEPRPGRARPRPRSVRSRPTTS